MKWILIVVGLLALAAVVVVIIGLALPKAHVATRSLNLRQSPDTVYALIAGPPTWRSTVPSYEPVGLVDGKLTWREVDAHNHGITFEEVEALPPRRRVTRIADKNLPFGGTWTYEIEPSGNGARLRITENGEVYNPIFRFISRYVMGHTATINQYLKDVAAHFNEPAAIEN